MITFRSITLLLALPLLSGISALAADETSATNAPSPFSYNSFEIIPQRNIFNQNRSGRSRGFTRNRSERRVRSDSFALRGTMNYEKGWFAFFDGTSSDYRKAVQPSDSIAGFKVTSVGPDSVKLDANGKQIELQIGMQMKRPDGGEWQMASGSEPMDTASSTNSAGETNSTVEPEGDDSPSTEAPAPASSGGESDILKRLMQKREQEVNSEAGKAEPRKQ